MQNTHANELNHIILYTWTNPTEFNRFSLLMFSSVEPCGPCWTMLNHVDHASAAVWLCSCGVGRQAPTATADGWAGVSAAAPLRHLQRRNIQLGFAQRWEHLGTPKFNGLQKIARNHTILEYLRRGERKPASHLSLCSPILFTQGLFTQKPFLHILFTHILFTQRLFTQKLLLHRLFTQKLFLHIFSPVYFSPRDSSPRNSSYKYFSPTYFHP